MTCPFCVSFASITVPARPHRIEKPSKTGLGPCCLRPQRLTSQRGRARGAVSFRREKFIEFGGPDGGNGARDGDVIVECVANLNTLLDYRYKQHFKAKKGGHGMGKNRTGAKRDDVVLAVPPGTQIFDEDGETLIADLTEPGERFVLARDAMPLHNETPRDRASAGLRIDVRSGRTTITATSDRRLG